MCVLVAQLCPILCDPVDCSLPGSSVHGMLLARILEWVAMPSSRGCSPSWDRTHSSWVSCLAGRFFIVEPLKNHLLICLFSKFCWASLICGNPLPVTWGSYFLWPFLLMILEEGMKISTYLTFSKLVYLLVVDFLHLKWLRMFTPLPMWDHFYVSLWWLMCVVDRKQSLLFRALEL